MKHNLIIILTLAVSLLNMQGCKKDKDAPSTTNNTTTGPVSASFQTNVSEGIAPFALNMTNTSTGATSYTWRLSYAQSGIYTCGIIDCSSSQKDASFNIEWPSNSSLENTASLTMNVSLESKNDAGSQFANKTVIVKNPKACARNVTASIATTITSTNPYRFYVDDVLYGTINGQSTKSFTIPSGIHTLKVEQISGYVLYPTVVTTTSTLNTCGSYTWTPVL